MPRVKRCALRASRIERAFNVLVHDIGCQCFVNRHASPDKELVFLLGPRRRAAILIIDNHIYASDSSVLIKILHGIVATEGVSAIMCHPEPKACQPGHNRWLGRVGEEVGRDIEDLTVFKANYKVRPNNETEIA